MSEGIPARVNAELKAAMKAKQKERLGTLRMIRAAVIEGEKSGREMSDADYHTMFRKLVKQRQEAAKAYRDGGREELAVAELAEVEVISEFLPSLADADKTREWVREAIASTGASGPGDMGRVMGALMKAHKAELDGNLARGIVVEELKS